MKLSVKGLALAGGLLWSVLFFIWTLLAAYTGYGEGGLEAFWVGIYPWYTVSVQGAFIGLGWAFMDGLVCGAILAWLYNKFS